jgi:predicted O-methyltransferase YrrM
MKDDFTELLETYQSIIDDLEGIVQSTGEHFEGNCFYKHDSFTLLPELVNKQRNIYTVAKTASQILEIGFNAGHSCLLMLLANDDSKITVIDNGRHRYTLKCYDYLIKLFPGRIEFLIGDSIEICSELKYKKPRFFDMVHVDGCHDYRYANLDFFQTKDMTTIGGFIIFDDTQIPHIQDLWNGYVKDGMVQNVDSILEATHAIGRVLG